MVVIELQTFFYRIESFQPEQEHGDTQRVANVVFFVLCLFCLCYIIWLIFVIFERLGLFKINGAKMKIAV